MKLMLAQIARWLATAPVEGHDAVAATGYSIDSRTVQAGELFFAIRGERFLMVRSILAFPALRSTVKDG